MAKELVHKYAVGTRVKVVPGPVPSDQDGRVGEVVHLYKYSQKDIPEYVVRMDHAQAWDDDWNILENKLELADEIGVEHE